MKFRNMKIKGITDQEIKNVKASFEYELPEAYIEFLRTYGKECVLGHDVQILYPFMLGLRADLLELIEEDNLDFQLPKNAFVFSEYQGFQYHYFLCGESDDPEVYRIMDGNEPPYKVADRFSNYIKQALNENI